MFRLVKDVVEAVRRGQRFVTHDVWHIGLPGEEIPHGFIIKNIRVAILLVKGLVRDQLPLRASSLTFATMLAVVPFLAIMFFAIHTFNLGEGIYELLAPLSGEPAAQTMSDGDLRNQELWEQFIAAIFRGFENGATEAGGESVSAGANGAASKTNGEMVSPVQFLVTFAERSSDPKTLTLAGVVFVLSTVIGLMMNIEGCFNTIWGLRSTRSWYRMFSDYLFILVMIPFLVAAVLSVTAILENSRSVSRLGPFAFGLRGVQYVVSWLAFTALYFFVPNTRVKFRYALFAGIVAGTCWCLLSLAYVRFQYGLARYKLIYWAFAQVPFLLMWVYFSWLVVLLGAELTFAYQNEKTFAMERLAQGASYAYNEAVGLWAMMELGKRFDAGMPGLPASAAAEAWNVPTRLLNDILQRLEDGGLVSQSVSNPPAYQPARSLDKITVHDVVTCLRESGRDPSALRENQSLRSLLDTIAAGSPDLADRTIAQLVRQTSPEQPAPDVGG